MKSDLVAAYRSMGLPKVHPFLLASFEKNALLVGPPPLPSYVFISEELIRLNAGDLHVAEKLIGDSFAAPKRIQPILLVFLAGHWLVWMDEGPRPFTHAIWKELIDGRSHPVPLEAWPENLDLQSCLVSLGFPNPRPVEGSIRQYLSNRSNDYWAAEKLFRLLSGLDLVSGDAVQLNVEYGEGSISVVIPAYNSNDTIEYTLNAISEAARLLPQGVELEIIVVDDNSRVPLNIVKYGATVKVVCSQHQLHCGGARNLGLSLAKGELAIFIDSDTCIEPNYLVNHWLRHQIFPNLILVSMREYLPDGENPPSRKPIPSQDTRWQATYGPDWKGLTKVEQLTTVAPLTETEYFKRFGYGRKIGPTDLPFMVKGNNLSVSRACALEVGFPPNFKGWGPEDVCFAAKMISRGHFVVPLLSSGVFHLNHPLRSRSPESRIQELSANLQLYDQYLDSSPFLHWRTPALSYYGID